MVWLRVFVVSLVVMICTFLGAWFITARFDRRLNVILDWLRNLEGRVREIENEIEREQ